MESLTEKPPKIQAIPKKGVTKVAAHTRFWDFW